MQAMDKGKGLRIYVVAGEKSGDMHAARLIHALRNSFPNAVFRGVGGEEMEREGVEIWHHYRRLSVVGLFEILTKLPLLLRVRRACKKDILHYRPRAVLYIDFPGFNLSLVKFVKSLGALNLYYIVPKTWLWREFRVKKLRRYVDHLFGILPFEPDYFAKHQCALHYVGNPSANRLSKHRYDTSWMAKEEAQNPQPKVALFPGSRKNQVSILKHLQPLIVARPDTLFYVSQVDNVDRLAYGGVEGLENVRLVMGRSYEILKLSRAAIVNLGTSSLEAALIGVPHMVCLKLSWLTGLMLKKLFIPPYFCLPNLILGKKSVPEYIHDGINFLTLSKTLDKLMHDEAYRKEMEVDFEEVRKRLGTEDASVVAAQRIAQVLHKLPISHKK